MSINQILLIPKSSLPHNLGLYCLLSVTSAGLIFAGCGDPARGF